MQLRDAPMNTKMAEWMGNPRNLFPRQNSLSDYLQGRVAGVFSGGWAEEPNFVTAHVANALDIHRELGALNAKVSRLERLVRDQHELLLILSQSYYWTPEWQEKEKRAEMQMREGEGIEFQTVEDLIQHLHSSF